jgi:NAD/NADP transhydrogenase beta subunit
MFKDRSTTDIVVLLLTILVCIILIMLIGGAIVGKLIHPQMEMTNITEVVTIMVSNISGALIGWIGGKAAGRMEANGK